MNVKVVTYTEIIQLRTSENFPIRFNLTEDNDDVYYDLYTYDGSDYYSCKINNIDNPTEVSDFETNYKDFPGNPFNKRNDFNLPVVAPSLEDVMGLYPKKKGQKAVVTAGAINFFDTEVLTEKRICGGEYWIKEEDISKVHEDD